MDDRRGWRLGNVRAEDRGELVDNGVVGGFGAMPLIGPPPHLPLEVAGWLANVAEADGVVVDLVDRREHFDEPLAQRGRRQRR